MTAVAGNERGGRDGDRRTELRSVDVAGRRLRVAVRRGTRPAGGADPHRRPALLLVNGIGASLEVWQPFVAELDGSVDVIAFDPPGVGGSPRPERPYRLTGLCRLIAAMLSTLGYDTVDVLGISWGGAVAQHFAAFQRRRCRRLVLVATATGAVMVPARPAVLARMATPRRYLDADYLQRVAPNLYGGSARTEPDRVRALLHAGTRRGSRVGYFYQLVAGVGWTSLGFLPLLRAPTLILSGDDDPLIPLANARLLRRLIRGSSLHVYRGGHLDLVTRARSLAPVVDRFLAAPDAATTRS